MELLFDGYGLKILRERRRLESPLVILRGATAEHAWELQIAEANFAKLLDQVRQRLGAGQ